MQRVPALTPVAWRDRGRFAVHPVAVLPLAAVAGLAVVLAQALADPGADRFVAAAQWLGLALALSPLLPWHPSRRPVHEPQARAITFRAPRPLALLPVGLVVWGAALVVDFELMRAGVIGRGSQTGIRRIPGFDWWWTLPLGVVLVCVGVYLARPQPTRSLTVSAHRVVLRSHGTVVSLPWDRIAGVRAVVGRHGSRQIVIDAPGYSMRLQRGGRGSPTILAEGLDSDPVRLWLTLQHYFTFPQHRRELGTDRARRRRAQWRRWWPASSPD